MRDRERDRLLPRFVERLPDRVEKEIAGQVALVLRPVPEPREQSPARWVRRQYAVSTSPSRRRPTALLNRPDKRGRSAPWRPSGAARCRLRLQGKRRRAAGEQERGRQQE